MVCLLSASPSGWRAFWVILLLSLGSGALGAQGWEDNFQTKNLDPRWTWRVPVAGPTLSLQEKPGCLRVHLPARDEGFNHWNEPKPVDEAPQLRAAVPEGDWELEAHLRLAQFDPANHFQVGLCVGVNDAWLLALGPAQAPNLEGGTKTPEVWLEPTGSSGFSKVPGDARDVRLQLIRTGSVCRARVSRDGATWVDAGAALLPEAPKFVGILGKTFSPGPAIAFDVEYVRLKPLPPPAQPLRVGVGGTFPTGYHGLMARLGLPHEVLLDYQLADVNNLRRFDLLFIGSMNGGVEDRGRQALMEYVRGGGIAVLDSNVFPPASVVAGQGGRVGGQDLPEILIGGANNPLVPLVGKNTRLGHGESGFCFNPASEMGLQVLARFDGEVSIGGKPKPAQGYIGTPAVWARSLGKGLLVYSAPSLGASLSWGPSLDPLADALVRLLGGSWFEPQLVPEGVRLGRKETAPAAPAEPAAPARAEEFTRRRLSSKEGALPKDAALVEDEPAPEFNLSSVYHPERGRASLLLNHWSGAFQVSAAFEPARVRLTCFEKGKVVDTAQIPLGGAGPWPFLVKERRERIILLVGSRQASVRAGTLWQGKLASTGKAFDDVHYQPVEPPHLSDDFVRAEGEQGTWEVVTGEWSVKAEGDPKMGVNPFSYHGQAKGVGLSAIGWGFWDDYAADVSVRPTEVGTVGEAFYYQDEKNHLLFRARVCDAPREEKGGFELVRVENGQEQVIARHDGCLVKGHWYRLSVQAHGGMVSASVDGERVAAAEEKTLAGGKVALYVRDGQAEFDDVEVRPAAEAAAPALAELDGGVPQFAGTLDRDTWAGTALQWRPEREAPGLFWRRGRFYGDFDLSFRCNFDDPAAGQAVPPAMTLLLAAEGGAAKDGCALTLRPAGPPAKGAGKSSVRSFTLELARAGAPAGRATVTAGERPLLELRRAGGRLLALVDGRQALAVTVPEALRQLPRLGFRASGFRPRLSGLTLSAGSVLDYCFSSAPTDWWTSSGTWAISNRWPCTPEWSWFGGQSKQIAAIWHKRRFTGDTTLDVHVGPWEIDHGDGVKREICRAFNVVLCGDGEDVHSGYSFVLGEGKAGAGATLSRNGKVVARNPDYRIFSDAHNQWFNVRAEKRGAQISLWVGDQQILSWKDPEPLPGGRVGIWTEDNGIMIPRATIYSQEAGAETAPGLGG